MKSIRIHQLLLPSILLTASVLMTGCETMTSSSDSSDPFANLPGGITTSVIPGENVPLHKDKDIQGVWLKPGFNFTGYSSIDVQATEYAAEIREEEAHERAVAIRQVQESIQATAQGTGLFATGSGKTLRVSNTIIKFAKGGGGARYFAGIYGAGQPRIRVRGQVYDGSTLVAVYEVERSGESAGARLNGAWRSDESILSNDIADLANDLADFFKRTAGR